jgi:HD-GYP domain-containing protein (c-di-GMP phosphodiesterase class II)
MKTRIANRTLLLFITLLGFALPLFGASLDTALADAHTQYAQGNYAGAVKILSQAENLYTDMDSRSAMSDAYTEFALKEYSAQNYQNAYDCFRSALRLNPINQIAIQGYLKLKREHGTSNLQNLGKPSVAAPAETPTSAGSTSTDGAPSTIKTPGDLQNLVSQLKDAESKLNQAQSSVTNTAQENSSLKAEIEQQKHLVEQLLKAQTSHADRPITSQESASVQKSLTLLAEIAAQNAQSRPQVVVQPDPTIQTLLHKLEAESQTHSSLSISDIAGLISAVLLSLAFLLVIVILILARHRNRKTPSPSTSPEVLNYQLSSPNAPALLVDQRRPALLEFIDPAEPSPNKDVALHQALLKADRLQKMYDEVKNGTLSWETVRAYLDELDTALKSEILKVVERRLSAGDLISNQAILPVLFPFLTDYDEFISDKAQKLAKVALIEDREAQKLDSGPLSVNELLVIPDKLEQILRGRDRTRITAKLSHAVARELGLSASDCKLIYKGALAHDAGYLMINADQLQKIIGKAEITEEDFEVIKSHVNLGLNYFGDAELDPEIRNAILYHHERNDGSGYPNGLKKEEIPQSAKIIGVCETFATLIQSRSYREKVALDHALAIVKDSARLKFDREIVEALVKVVSMVGGLS